MKHYGDITKINGAEVPIVDIICGGSPCQDLSVAGKRAGLEGERSGLFMEQIRIVKEQRNECIRQLSMRGANVNLRLVKPRWLIWENVPGALSSGTPKGGDFRCVLEEICRIADQTATVPMPEKGKWSTSGAIVGDGWSVAWRVHDAQFWGVPQRRRRISVVADFAGESAPEVLFERESLPGDIKQSKQKGEDTSRAVGNGTQKASNVFGDEIMPCLVARVETAVGNTQDGFNVISFQERAGKPGGGKGILIQNEKTASIRTQNNQSVCCYGMDNERRRGPDEWKDMSPTVTSRAGTGGNNIPVVIEGNGSRPSHKGDGYKESEVSYTLNSTEVHGVCAEEPILLESNQNHATIQTDGVSTCLPASMGEGGGYVPMVTEEIKTYGLDRASFNQGKNAQYDFSVEEELAQTIVSRGPGGVHTKR